MPMALFYFANISKNFRAVPYIPSHLFRLLVAHHAVYRTTADGSPRYKVDDVVHHHHVVCTSCGKVDEFRHPAVERMLRAMRREVPGVIVGHRLEIFITCESCQVSVI